MKKHNSIIALIILGILLYYSMPSFSQDTKDNNKVKIQKDNPKKGDNSDVMVVVEHMPEFPGGTNALSKFLSSNIKYPTQAREEGTQGTVYITFVVMKDGKLGMIKVLRGIGSGCDEEAMRVIKMMPKWKPGKQNGKNVNVLFNLPIKFTLDGDSKEKNVKKK